VRDSLLRDRPHQFRDHARVEYDHDSKSGISMRMPRISAMGSSKQTPLPQNIASISFPRPPRGCSQTID
jgi:hypothetical protein